MSVNLADATQSWHVESARCALRRATRANGRVTVWYGKERAEKRVCQVSLSRNSQTILKIVSESLLLTLNIPHATLR